VPGSAASAHAGGPRTLHHEARLHQRVCHAEHGDEED
jgi:hypothetical protein